MRKIALIAGCSHIAGAEIDGLMDSKYNRDHSFGSVLATKMGYEPINIALNGSANSGIARSILNWFNDQYDPATMEVFVIIGWTESSRLEVPATDRPGDFFSGNPAVQWYDSTANSYYRINYGWEGHTAYEKKMIPTYHEFMADNETILECWAATAVLMVQYFLASNNIDYVMCNTMRMFTENCVHTKSLVDNIDQSKYYKALGDADDSFYFTYKNLGYVNEKAKYWHHGTEPHELYAEELHTFIKGSKNV